MIFSSIALLTAAAAGQGAPTPAQGLRCVLYIEVGNNVAEEYVTRVLYVAERNIVQRALEKQGQAVAEAIGAPNRYRRVECSDKTAAPGDTRNNGPITIRTKAIGPAFQYPDTTAPCGLFVENGRPYGVTHYQRYVTQPIPADQSDAAKALLEREQAVIMAKIGISGQPIISCGNNDFKVGFREIGTYSSSEVLSLDPYFKLGPTTPKKHRLTLHWRGHDGNSEGYQSASIGLNYTFLQCAGEIQIAYAIDRASFTVSRNYFVPAGGGREALFTQVDPPAAPASLRLVGTIMSNDYPRRVVGNIDDRFAGEALGMGCFDGQTKKLGTVAALVGPGATPDKVKTFLDRLTLEVPMYMGPPLTRAGMAGKASEADRIAKQAEERRLAAEARAKDAAQVDALNATALKAVQDKGREIDAKMAAVRKAQVDYEASMVRHRQVLAEAERKRQLYEAQMALYRACVAGDRAACDRHRAGQ